MSVIRIQGLHPLKGELSIQGSKNAALPMMAAAVLHRGTTVLSGVPRIRDVFCMVEILRAIGCRCEFSGHRLVICGEGPLQVQVPGEYVTAMRSSVVLLGALLGRCGDAVLDYPGGCSIGSRPIDFHLQALRTMGAEIEEQDGRIYARGEALSGASISLPYPSVGATENILLAAVLADGVTVICGAAREPEITELCRMLQGMGAQIGGIGTDCLRIRGVKTLHDSSFSVAGDRIVAGTYAGCVMAAGGSAVLRGICPDYLAEPLKVWEAMGAEVRLGDQEIRIRMVGSVNPISVRTEPYPGFPTDLQSPLLSLLSMADGRGRIEETVFEGRFATASQLEKMGARIQIAGRTAETEGVYPLSGAKVSAPDLRGGAALVAAGLGAEGETVIDGCIHILRGYEDICGDLAQLGAQIIQEEN